MKINHKFRPLFNLDQPQYKNISYIIMTGGRNSMKSYCISAFATLYVINHGSLLYSRYTNSVVSSTIANDIKERISEFRADHKFNVTSQVVTYANGNQILFKGLKAQTNNTDANNKGINNYKVAILDEAQDLTDEKAFNRFNLSIRSANENEKSLVVLVLNPTNKEHWIYKRFFKKRDIPDGFNGIVDDTIYIHTTYIDALQMGIQVDKKIIKEADEMKEEDHDYYRNIFLGYFAEVSNTLIFPRMNLKYTKELPMEYDYTYGYIDVADTGTDYLAFVMAGVKDGITYIFDVYYTKENIDITLPKVVELINTHKFDMVRIEANNMGRGFYRQVKKELGDDTVTKLLTATNSINKIVRIVNASYNIKKRFVFLDKSIQNKMYYNFMEDLHTFNSDGNNANDDGADALTGLWTFLNSTYYKYETN